MPMNPPETVVNYLLHGAQTTICRLCYKEGKPSFSSIYDEININSAYYNGIVSLKEIIECFSNLRIDGVDVPSVICKKCSHQLLKHFIFMQLCRTKENYWQIAIDRLLNELNNKMETRKSVYLDVTKAIVSKSNDKNKPVDENYGKICEICGQDFPTTLKMKIHKKTHFHENIECKNCGEIFKNKATISKHLRYNCKSVEQGDFKCYKCGRIFKSLVAIEKHKTLFCNKDTKINSEPSICKWCEKRCKNSITLKKHHLICKNRDKSVIDSEVKYSCEICSASFCLKARLKHHLQVVHTERNIPCEVCAKLFKTVRHVQNHMVVHTKEKQFKCEFCEKFFVAKNALVYHQRLHTGERPFPCTLCDERFLSASRRMTHMRKKHWGRQFECRICHSKYHTNSDLRLHEKRHFKLNTKLERVAHVFKVGADNELT